ncbi:ABC transporter permease [Oceanirhabdus sp. W0125-5]|uniref:ABC transporter permease n=1 Tax=Oceanirhabdus sp. W0125-5 TaxID=2999116 RepID=UPI0022F32D32|nr:ABC transporter permease [Oceanirhabdus sp. W0125-5]WBW97777.1 ABC transporter permease [Oceanirhabdus sp. W0125-5]
MNIVSILEQGLIFAIAALGISMSYKILNFPDLSVDGSFPLGAAVASILLVNGYSPFIALIIATLSGGISGVFTGYIHTKFNITNLLSGIIVMIALYSVNLRIMGKANVHLFNTEHLFKNKYPALLIIFILLFSCKLLIDYLLKTKFGYVLRSLGDNPNVVNSLGLDDKKYKIIGLMIANGLVALSGGILAQYQGFADIGMGTGILVTGLASIILGEQILKANKHIKLSTMVIVGSIIYRLIIAISLKVGFAASDLKLITAVILLGILVMDSKKHNIRKLFTKELGVMR